MSSFGVKIPPFPEVLRTEHFTNNQLRILYEYFSVGNTLHKPSDLGPFVEAIFKYKNLDDFRASAPGARHLMRDGLGSVLCLADMMRTALHFEGRDDSLIFRDEEERKKAEEGTAQAKVDYPEYFV